MHVHLQNKAEIAENKQNQPCLNLQNLDLDSGSASRKPHTDNESESESD